MRSATPIAPAARLRAREAAPRASEKPTPIAKAGARIARPTARHSDIVSQPCFTVHSSALIDATVANPVSAWVSASQKARLMRRRNRRDASRPPAAMPASTVASMAVNASAVAVTNCSISRNHSTSRPSEAKPEMATTQ